MDFGGNRVPPNTPPRWSVSPTTGMVAFDRDRDALPNQDPYGSDEDVVASLFDGASVDGSITRNPYEKRPTLGSSVIWSPPRSKGPHQLERTARSKRMLYRKVNGVISTHRLHGGDTSLQSERPRRPIKKATVKVTAETYEPPAPTVQEELSMSQSMAQSAYSHLTNSTHFSHRPPLLILPFELDPAYDKPPGPFRNSGALGKGEKLAYNWTSPPKRKQRGRPAIQSEY